MLAYEMRVANRLRGASRSRNEWSAWFDLVAPGVDLFAPRDLLHQSLELVGNAASQRRFASALGMTQSTLRRARVPILVESKRRKSALVPAAELKRTQRRWLGQLVLQLYFTQLFRCDTAMLDLSPSRLGINVEGDAVWTPRAFYVRWDFDFLRGLRDVYAGFFADDQTQFRAGLRNLGVEAADELLLRHLGGETQRSVRFSRAELHSTLQEICDLRTSGAGTLHRNFVAFGLHIASLHELLESLDCSFDVRSAFMRSQRRA